MCLISVYGAVQDKSSEQQHKNDFIAFDLNQDSFVDASEVRSQFRGLKQEDISAFFIAADKDEDGLITFEEYLAASLRHDEGELDLDDYKFQ
jgi:Ca2+-binding EF-hand superfamily protein